MNKLSLAQIVKKSQTFVTKHSPEILTGVGIAGMITTTVLAVRATPKAIELLDEAQAEKHRRTGRWDGLTVGEKVKTAWKPYIPAVITGAASTACLIGSVSVSSRRTAALAAAYQISETALAEYHEKVVATVGEKKENAIREAIAADQVAKVPVDEDSIIRTGFGDTLCFEPLSARYFYSDMESIRRAENAINKQLLHEVSGTATLNEFYDELGIPHTELGDDIGWSSSHLIDLHISTQMSDKGKPAIVVGHYAAPRYDYEY